MRPLLLFTILLFLICSCKKDRSDIDGESTKIVGEYEWYYSSKDVSNTISQASTPDRYGIRITKKANFIIDKNGNKIFKGYIKSLNKHWDNTQWRFRVDDSGVSETFIIENGILKCDKWPHWGYTNEWIKK